MCKQERDPPESVPSCEAFPFCWLSLSHFIYISSLESPGYESFHCLIIMFFFLLFKTIYIFFRLMDSFYQICFNKSFS